MKNGALKKSWWPIGLITVFVVFISWIATFIGIAVNSRWDLVTPDYYEQEVRYQERIDAMNRLNALTDFRMSHDHESGSVVVKLPDEHVGKALKGSFKFYRPDDASLDRIVAVQPAENGTQTLSTASLKPGSWKLEASWELNGEQFYSSMELRR